MVYKNWFIGKSFNVWRGLVLVFVSVFSIPLHAQEKIADPDKQPIIISVEYLKEYKESPGIATTTVDLFYPIGAIEDLNLALYTGLTATEATDTQKNATYERTVRGIGPNVFATVDLMHWKDISFLFDASGAFLFYNKEFPAGGEKYNFVWRVGPTLAYSFADTYSIGISYRWMHVSNGQNNNNPGYEATGFGLKFSKVF